MLLSAISPVLCASTPHSILHIALPDSELTILPYSDVVASAQLTILKVSNPDETIIVYANVSAVQFVVLVVFAKVSRNSEIIRMIQRVRLH